MIGQSATFLDKAGEPIRLVIWDLDETFWKGTLTEGGISDYVDAHHQLVITLAERGIMSSICSKNDAATVMSILVEKSIRDYFIFPSISWDPKGPRIAALIEQVGLRPATVMFIDDNPSNRAEARHLVPGLQVEDETFVARMLNDPRFKGKDDRSLSRLRQYQFLEKRRADEAHADGSNEDFLRTCNIRVYVEYDVLAYSDRCIELINRTNQLNFTKHRLPDDPAAARAELSKLCGNHSHHAGLIRVVDDYGDYGFVGFFLTRAGRDCPEPGAADQTLIHFCFSCRTIGMLVEHWAYNQFLRRPKLDVIGEVLTDVFAPWTVDWIRRVDSLSDAASCAELAPVIRMLGGCEAASVGHYLAAYTPDLQVTGNFPAGRMFVRVNSVLHMLSAMDHTGPWLDAELAQFGVPSGRMLGTEYFRDAPPGTLFVFSGSYDAEYGQYRYRHKDTGWIVKIEVNGYPLDIAAAPEEELAKLEALRLGEEVGKGVMAAARHVRSHYASVMGAGSAELDPLMRRFFGMVPAGSRLVLMLDDDRWRLGDGKLIQAPWVTRYNAQIRALAAEQPFVAVASFTDHIRGEDEIQVGGNHYDRIVYHRMAQEIITLARTLSAKE